MQKDYGPSINNYTMMGLTAKSAVGNKEKESSEEVTSRCGEECLSHYVE